MTTALDRPRPSARSRTILLLPASSAALRCHAPLLSHVLDDAADLRLGAEDVAGSVDREPLAHHAVGKGRRHVRRHEHRHLAIREWADAHALAPAGMYPLGRLGVDRIEHVAGTNRHAADPAEGIELGDRRA